MSVENSGNFKVEFLYDYMGRRVEKKVYDYAGGSFNLTETKLFIYDGWNLIEEKVTPTGQAEEISYYVWGLDLSQSIQGAGGVGGLLAKVEDSSTKYYCYDANGNVTQLIDGSDGTILCHYEYDPFGNITYSSGSDVSSNSFLLKLILISVF